MQRKIVVFIAASLDGYIATPEDRLDWLFRVQGEGDNGYTEFVQTVDTVIMGRRTYNWLLHETGREGFPYREQTCYVYSKSEKADYENVIFLSEPVASLAVLLRQQPGKDIRVVGGGRLIDSFLEEDLIDEWIITLAPVLLGDGIPLFGKRGFKTELTLTGVRQYGQFAQLHYTRTHPAESSSASDKELL